MNARQNAVQIVLPVQPVLSKTLHNKHYMGIWYMPVSPTSELPAIHRKPVNNCAIVN